MIREPIVKQVEKFVSEYGEDPVYPIKLSYRWNGVTYQGVLNGLTIRGVPGMIDIRDESVTNVVFLEDGLRRTMRAVDPPSALVGGGNSENSAGN